MITRKKSPVLEEHRDGLNNLLSVGDYVAYPTGNSLRFGRVVKLTPKMVRVVPAASKYSTNGLNKYAFDLVRLESSAMTFYLLKHV